jgi:hypothetical protein
VYLALLLLLQNLFASFILIPDLATMMAVITSTFASVIIGDAHPDLPSYSTDNYAD